MKTPGVFRTKVVVQSRRYTDKERGKRVGSDSQGLQLSRSKPDSYRDPSQQREPLKVHLHPKSKRKVESSVCVEKPLQTSGAE